MTLTERFVYLTEGYTNQRMYMLRMSQNEELVYAVLVNERARNLGGSMNGAEQSTEQRMLLEYGLEGANILQQSEIYASKLDGQFEVGTFIHSHLLSFIK